MKSILKRRSIFKIIRKYTGVEDPYLDVKKRSNEEALQLLPWVRKVVQESDDPLRASVLVSIAGNIIDAATVDEYDLKATILKTLETKPRIDHYELLKEDVKGAETLLYFADNLFYGGLHSRRFRYALQQRRQRISKWQIRKSCWEFQNSNREEKRFLRSLV